MVEEGEGRKRTPPREVIQDFSADVRRKISEFETEKAVGALLSAPKMIRREPGPVKV